MPFLTESRLRAAYYRSARTTESVQSIHKSFSAGRQPDSNIFLSHSHLDRDLIRGFIQELKELGVFVYVDWNDKTMPQYTNRETADKIKHRIKQSDLFMIFATENAMRSRWVPWEIGVADQAKTGDSIFVIPVSGDDADYSGNEYLQLYNKIIISDQNDFAAFKPGFKNGVLLKSVIRQKGYDG